MSITVKNLRKMTSGSLLSRSKSSVANNYPDPRVNRGLRPGLRVDPTNFLSPNGSNRVDHFSRPNPRVDPGFRNWVPALLKDMDVRWGSTLSMCDRYLQQSTAVIATGDRLQLKLNLPTQSELQQVRLVCKLLRTFDRVTTEMSSQKFVRSSQVGPFICICVYNFNYHNLN